MQADWVVIALLIALVCALAVIGMDWRDTLRTIFLRPRRLRVRCPNRIGSSDPDRYTIRFINEQGDEVVILKTNGVTMTHLGLSLGAAGELDEILETPAGPGDKHPVTIQVEELS